VNAFFPRDITRREFIAGGIALVVVSRLGLPARAAETGLGFSGRAAQGGLVIGHVPEGARVWVNGEPVNSAGGVFCFGFNYNDTDAVPVRVVFADGSEVTRDVTPETREFDVQRIDGLPQQFVTPPPEVEERVARDARAVVAARMHDTDQLWFAEELAWPIEGRITGNFGNYRILNGEPRDPHYGVDIAAPEGTAIAAPTGGIVRLAEDLFLSGNTIVLDHGHGVSTTYLHMSAMDVTVGDTVARGDTIGRVGATGRATGPHLCWRMNWFQKRLDVALAASARA